MLLGPQRVDSVLSEFRRARWTTDDGTPDLKALQMTSRNKILVSTNIVVVVVMLAVASLRWLRAEPPTTSTPNAPQIEGVDYSKTHYTVLLILRRTCVDCVDSAPFYRRLIQMRNDQSKALQVVAAARDHVDDFKAFLDKNGIIPDEVAVLRSDMWKTTPTVILVDELGFARKIWTGRLPPEVEHAVLMAAGLER